MSDLPEYQPKVGHKINGKTIESVEFDQSTGTYFCKFKIDPECIPFGCEMNVIKADPVFEQMQRYSAGFEKDKYKSLEEVARPLIKWINDNANPHAIIVIDGSSAVLYSGEKSVLTEEFIKD